MTDKIKYQHTITVESTWLLMLLGHKSEVLDAFSLHLSYCVGRVLTDPEKKCHDRVKFLAPIDTL